MKLSERLEELLSTATCAWRQSRLDDERNENGILKQRAEQAEARAAKAEAERDDMMDRHEREKVTRIRHEAELERLAENVRMSARIHDELKQELARLRAQQALSADVVASAKDLVRWDWLHLLADDDHAEDVIADVNALDAAIKRAERAKGGGNG